jgi:hypothetical protein
MTLFALYGASVPITQMTINESNRVRLDGTSSVRAVGDVDMMAEQGIGGSERAETDGLVINVSFIPYAMSPIGEGKVNSLNEVVIGNQAKVEAGINYNTVIQILPYFVDGVQKLPSNRIDTDLSESDKQALGLDPAQQYEYAALRLADVEMGITSGDIVEAVAGAFGKAEAGKFYRYSPATYSDENRVLEKENYLDTTRWKGVRPDHQLSGSEVGLTLEKGQLVRTRMVAGLSAAATIRPLTQRPRVLISVVAGRRSRQ